MKNKTRPAKTTKSARFRATLPFAVALALVSLALPAADLPRPPSVPLVACDPYFSIWSPADHLADADTVHWTGRPHRLTGLVRIDGKTFRLMGKGPSDFFVMQQTSVQVLPTRTVFGFEGEGVRLAVTFMTPALPDDLMVCSRPVTYVTWEAHASDGKAHNVEVYLDAGAEIVVNAATQPVAYQAPKVSGLTVASVGSVEQPVLQKKGDDLRIDWGHLYLAAPATGSKSAQAWIASATEARESFRSTGVSRQGSGIPAPGQPAKDAPVIACALQLGRVSSSPVSRWMLLAYDDEYSIQYFKQNLRPYWRRNGDDASALLKKSAVEYDSLLRRCADFDKRLMADLTAAGGDAYARICALAYRQCLAANKIVADANGQPLVFPKENFSNGCIGTVDVIYPMAPQFLLLSPSLTKAMLVPIMDYAASPRWRWPFAPHDLGTYPHANGQVYGGGERTEENQMPVEETGNMLVLLAALAKVEGNVDFCSPYWPVLDKWADYLKAKGFDPENQLCTDDFAGHLAHNVNLSAKAICGLGAYALLLEMRGEKARAQEVTELARSFAARWVKEADDGDHFRLAFDKPGTWSQKYNLVWDRILGLGLFPAEVLRKELAFYRTHQNTYGLPLDSRKDYTKLDWTIWSASLTQDRADFDALVAPVYRFLNETSSRVPMTDWYDTKTGKMVGFQARSVVGGVFIQMLYDLAAWKKWAARDTTRASKWAPLPKPPKTVALVPTSESAPITWRYTTTPPAEGWSQAAFDDSSWTEGKGGFGTRGTPGAVIGTEWKTPDIWLRREFSLANNLWADLQLLVHHDEDVEIYLNGVLAGRFGGFTTEYEVLAMNPQARAALKPGRNSLAVHCHQTGGGQFVDVGLVDVRRD